MFKYEQSKDDFNALQLAIPSFNEELKSYDDQTEITKASIGALHNAIIQQKNPNVNQNILEKEGYLWKKAEGIVKVFQRRFVTIKENKFTYYREGKDIIEKGDVLNLLTTSVKPYQESGRPNCFQIIGLNNIWIFQAASEKELQEWIQVIQNNTLYSLEHQDNAQEISELANEDTCADCDAKNPTWCCLNWGNRICLQCSGIHRALGAHVSKVRSSTLDSIDKLYIDLINRIGNSKMNEILLANKELYEEDLNNPEITQEVLIQNKYEQHKYIDNSLKEIPFEEKKKALFDAIAQNDFELILKYVFQGVLNEFPASTFSPIHQAAAYGDQNITLLIALNTPDMNVLDEGGWSAMSYAAYYKRTNICSMLLKIGSDPMASERGFPYHISIQQCAFDISVLYMPYWKGEKTPYEMMKPPVEVIPISSEESKQ